MKTPRRRGITLLEMVTVITFGSILLGLGARTMVALIRVDRSGRDRLADDRSTALLARDFRGDVHASLAAKAPGLDGSMLDLDLGPGRLVRYAVDGDRLVRDERQGDRAVGKRVYDLRGRKPPGFEVVKIDEGNFVRLRIEGRGGSAPRKQNIEALVGWDHRFRKPGRDADARAN